MRTNGALREIVELGRCKDVERLETGIQEVVQGCEEPEDGAVGEEFGHDGDL